MTSSAENRPGAGAASPFRSSFRHPGFVLCVVTLAVFTGGFYWLTRQMQFRKEAVPLRKPLYRMDKAALAPYELREAVDIPPEVVDTLGTDMYIQWVLEDTSITDLSDRTKRAVLFVTYYTGQPDPVPHVPEVCYLGSGYKVESLEDDTLEIPEIGQTIPVRVLTFASPTRLGASHASVLYTFSANGAFASDRTQVRMRLGRPWERYAYFSKVEVRFDSVDGKSANTEELLAASRKLFGKVMPLLVEQHWPDWEALERQSSGGKDAEREGAGAAAGGSAEADGVEEPHAGESEDG
jgi:hypothetical protein